MTISKSRFAKKIMIVALLVLSSIAVSAPPDLYKGEDVKVGSSIYYNYQTVKVDRKRFYSSRPDVLKVEKLPKKIEKLGQKVKTWAAFEEAYMVALAQMVAAYPDAEYYFLARDIEYLYDVARVLFKNDKKMLARLHVIPVGSNVQQDERLIDYLEQEGLTKTNLKGRPALFVDSCCSGSIPDRLKAMLKPRGIKGMGYLFDSAKYPSSSLFSVLTQTDEGGRDIEDHPHYHETAEFIVKAAGRFEVMMGVMDTAETNLSLKAIKSIRTRFDNAKARARFQEVLGHFQDLTAYAQGSTTVTKKTAMAALQNLSQEDPQVFEAIINDLKTLSRLKQGSVNKSRISELSKVEIEVKSLNGLQRLVSIIGDEVNFAYDHLTEVESSLKAFAVLIEDEFSGPEFDSLISKFLTNLGAYFNSGTMGIDNLKATQLVQLSQLMGKVPVASYNISYYLDHLNLDKAAGRKFLANVLVGQNCSFEEGAALPYIIASQLVDHLNAIKIVKPCLAELQQKDVLRIFNEMFYLTNPHGVDLALSHLTTVPLSVAKLIQDKAGVDSNTSFVASAIKGVVLARERWANGFARKSVWISPSVALELKLPASFAGQDQKWIDVATKMKSKKSCESVLVKKYEAK